MGLPQPAMTSHNGAILTIGIVVRADRAAIVLPVATDTLLTNKSVCRKAVEAAKESLVAALTPVLSVNCWVSHLAAVGMDNGSIPYREDFSALTYPGEASGDELPAQLGGLVTFYPNIEDQALGAKLRHSRMTIPGLSETGITSGKIDDGIDDLLNTLASLMMLGFSAGEGSETWYRVLSAPAPGAPLASSLPRIDDFQVRRYLGVQRRRVLPHV